MDAYSCADPEGWVLGVWTTLYSMEKHNAVDLLRNTGLEPLEKHKATEVGSSSDRWLKKINVKTLDLDSPEETLYFQRKFIAMIMVKECVKLVIGSSD